MPKLCVCGHPDYSHFLFEGYFAWNTSGTVITNKRTSPGRCLQGAKADEFGRQITESKCGCKEFEEGLPPIDKCPWVEIRSKFYDSGPETIVVGQQYRLYTHPYFFYLKNASSTLAPYLNQKVTAIAKRIKMCGGYIVKVQTHDGVEDWVYPSLLFPLEEDK